MKVALIHYTPKTRKVAIGQLIMHGREHLVGIKPLGRRSIPIAETLDVFLLGAMDAAEDGAVVLDPMPNDTAAAMTRPCALSDSSDEISFAQFNTAVPQDVVDRGAVEIKVGQHEMHQIGLAFETHRVFAKA